MQHYFSFLLETSFSIANSVSSYIPPSFPAVLKGNFYIQRAGFVFLLSVLVSYSDIWQVRKETPNHTFVIVTHQKSEFGNSFRAYLCQAYCHPLASTPTSYQRTHKDH